VDFSPVSIVLAGDVAACHMVGQPDPRIGAAENRIGKARERAQIIRFFA
jgi:hypothetical protein